MVNTEEYKEILLVKEKELLRRMGREVTDARAASDEEVHSWGDESATDAERAEEFSLAGMDWTTLETGAGRTEAHRGRYVRQVCCR